MREKQNDAEQDEVMQEAAGCFEYMAKPHTEMKRSEVEVGHCGL